MVIYQTVFGKMTAMNAFEPASNLVRTRIKIAHTLPLRWHKSNWGLRKRRSTYTSPPHGKDSSTTRRWQFSNPILPIKSPTFIFRPAHDRCAVRAAPAGEKTATSIATRCGFRANPKLASCPLVSGGIGVVTAAGVGPHPEVQPQVGRVATNPCASVLASNRSAQAAALNLL